MPYATNKVSLADPFLDRRVKLLPCMKERICDMYDNEGYSMNRLAKVFHVNKRMISFVLFPEKLEVDRSYARLRKHEPSKLKSQHVTEHRRYKHSLKELLINGGKQGNEILEVGHTPLAEDSQAKASD